MKDKRYLFRDIGMFLVHSIFHQTLLNSSLFSYLDNDLGVSTFTVNGEIEGVSKWFVDIPLAVFKFIVHT